MKLAALSFAVVALVVAAPGQKDDWPAGVMRVDVMVEDQQGIRWPD